MFQATTKKWTYSCEGCNMIMEINKQPSLSWVLSDQSVYAAPVHTSHVQMPRQIHAIIQFSLIQSCKYHSVGHSHISVQSCCNAVKSMETKSIRMINAWRHRLAWPSPPACWFFLQPPTWTRASSSWIRAVWTRPSGPSWPAPTSPMRTWRTPTPTRVQSPAACTTWASCCMSRGSRRYHTQTPSANLPA